MKNPEIFFSEFFYIHYFPENIFFISIFFVKKFTGLKKNFLSFMIFFDF